MTIYDYLKRVFGVADDPPAKPAMAQITIISSTPVKSSSGTPSPRSQG